MPHADTIKILASHIVAVILAIGGPVLIVWLFMNGQAVEGREGVMAMLGGFTGLAIQFLFQTNTQAAARTQTRNDILTPTVTPEA